jgi:hypothetical protein
MSFPRVSPFGNAFLPGLSLTPLQGPGDTLPMSQQHLIGQWWWRPS